MFHGIWNLKDGQENLCIGTCTNTGLGFDVVHKEGIRKQVAKSVYRLFTYDIESFEFGWLTTSTYSDERLKKLVTWNAASEGPCCRWGAQATASRHSKVPSNENASNWLLKTATAAFKAKQSRDGLWHLIFLTVRTHRSSYGYNCNGFLVSIAPIDWLKEKMYYKHYECTFERLVMTYDEVEPQQCTACTVQCYASVLPIHAKQCMHFNDRLLRMRTQLS